MLEYLPENLWGRVGAAATDAMLDLVQVGPSKS